MSHRLAAVLPLLLAGCAGTSATFPSLAPRAAEKLGFDEPARPSIAVAADPVLDARLAELDTRLRGVADGFATAADDAGRKAVAARGRPAGSDAWLEAQTGLAGLDDWRAQASSVATDVEELGIARIATLAPAYPALSELSERAEAEARRQSETIARLQAMLAPA